MDQYLAMKRQCLSIRQFLILLAVNQALKVILQAIDAER